MNHQPSRKQLIIRARRMRKSPTPPEGILWSKLRNKNIEDLKFRRQHVLHPYIVDFYCFSERLVIELDGAIHHDTTVQDYDRRRTEYLRRHHRVDQVLRFHNWKVLGDVEEVIAEIREVVTS